MITVTKGHAILQLPCGCNSRKFQIREENENEESQNELQADLDEISDFVDNHKKICWSKK